MYRRVNMLIVLLIAATGSFFQTPTVCAQASQSNPESGWVPALNHYVYYLEMPVSQDKAALTQVADVIRQQAGVLSCSAKGSPVSYFVVHTSVLVLKAAMENWAASAGTTLTSVIPHGSRAYGLKNTKSANTQGLQKKGSH